MPTIEKTLNELEYWFSKRKDAKIEQGALRPENFIDEEGYEQRRRELDDVIRDCHQKLKKLMERYEREPERHFLRHQLALDKFRQDGKYDDSVFIMTKYPAKDGNACGQELQAVIDAVVDGVKKRGYEPRIASAASFHRWLWDNVELYLLGCKHGIAIVEDRYLPELNPNVAMEWGWMTAMGRNVLFLRVNGFDHERADWNGLAHALFDWNDPMTGITTALDKFLPKRP